MIKIDWNKGFTGIDGRKYNKLDIETYYTTFTYDKKKNLIVYNRIKKHLESCLKLCKIQKEKDILSRLTEDLEDLLLASVDRLAEYKIRYDNDFRDLKKILQDKGVDTDVEIKNFKEKIEKAFGYTFYKSNTTLFEGLFKMLNIKSCPYCNMEYTLLVLKKSPGNEKLKNVFQIEHFYDKSTYPWLSMSLYNLVPSCGNCNHSKGNSELPLKFHPYNISERENIKFTLKGEVLELLLDSSDIDIIDIGLISSENSASIVTDDELNAFDNCFHISGRYMRHKDIVKETFIRSKLKEYYYDHTEDFDFLLGNDSMATIPRGRNDSLITKNTETFKRVVEGNYTEVEDYPLRPLSKFMKDISETWSI